MYNVQSHISIFFVHKHLCDILRFYAEGSNSRLVNRHNTFDQARIGTLGIKPRYVTEVFVDKENADMALHIIHTLS